MGKAESQIPMLATKLVLNLSKDVRALGGHR
jgi:hypothetical protein